MRLFGNTREGAFDQLLSIGRATETSEKEKNGIEGYDILEKIGSGTCAKVFKVMDKTDGSVYAGKTICLNKRMGRETGKDYFQREFHVLRTVNHPSIIGLHDVYFDDAKARVYIIMEYATGGDLASKKGTLNESELRMVFGDIARGLAAMHNQSLVHQDVKPANMLIAANGHAKLTDFGISVTFSKAGGHFGSPAYQAPELFSDDLDIEIDPAKTDVWSFGVSMYEIAFGKLPFEGDNIYEIARSALTHKLDIPDTASPEFKDLLKGMLNPDPAKRLTIEEVLEHVFFCGLQYPQEEVITISAELQFIYKDDFNEEHFVDLLQFATIICALRNYRLHMYLRPHHQKQTRHNSWRPFRRSNFRNKGSRMQSKCGCTKKCKRNAC